MSDFTVESLRKQGFRVTVHHKRRIKYVDGLKVKEILANRRDAIEKYNLHNLEVIQGMQAKGGETFASIEAPDGKVAFGTAFCRLDDPYVKKYGRENAIQRALEQMASQE